MCAQRVVCAPGMSVSQCGLRDVVEDVEMSSSMHWSMGLQHGFSVPVAQALPCSTQSGTGFMVGPQPCLWSQACTCVWWVRAGADGRGPSVGVQKTRLVEGDERAALVLGLGGHRRRGGGRVGHEQQEKALHSCCFALRRFFSQNGFRKSGKLLV